MEPMGHTKRRGHPTHPQNPRPGCDVRRAGVGNKLSCRYRPEYAIDLSLTDSVVARRTQNEVSVIVQVRAQNLDARTVYYAECGHALQRREGNAWRAVQLTRVFSQSAKL